MLTGLYCARLTTQHAQSYALWIYEIRPLRITSSRGRLNYANLVRDHVDVNIPWRQESGIYRSLRENYIGFVVNVKPSRWLY